MKYLIAAAMLMGAMAGAASANSGFSLSVGAGAAQVSDGATRGSASLTGGYALTDSVRAEAGYSYNGRYGGVDAHAMEGAVSGQLFSISPQLTVSGRLGLAYGVVDASGVSNSGWNPVFGLSTDYAISPQTAFVVSINHYPKFAGTTSSLDRLNAGFRYTF